MTSLPETLRTSVALLRTHPVMAFSLGAAIVLSLCSVFTGFGALAGPWFVCELYGVLISTAIGIRRPRTTAWISAAAVVLGTVLVIASAGWLAALEFGPDVATADTAVRPLPWPEALYRAGLIAGATALAVGFSAPFLYAPLILIDRGGRIGGAAIESAWLVWKGGFVRHLALAWVVYVLQLSPALLSAVVVARTFERAATPLGVALALPFLPFSIPLGQGILTAMYVERRPLLAAPRIVIARGLPPRGTVALLGWVVVAPLVALALLGLSALRPSTPSEGPAPSGETILERAIDDDAAIAVPDTTLVIGVRHGALTVTAGDGAGVGAIPLRGGGPIERVRVVRFREPLPDGSFARGDLYAIEIETGDRVVHARVDGAGTRHDDAIRRRLAQHVPTWALFTILAAFAACGAFVVRALAPLGSLRSAAEPAMDVRRASREDAHRRALVWGLVLAPFALAALVGGMVSIGWL